MTELELLLPQVPEPLRAAAIQRAIRYPESTVDMLREFLAFNEEDQCDLLGFFESDGPRIFDELDLQHKDGTPTSSDLEDWTTC